jgi:hypothetical protein
MLPSLLSDAPDPGFVCGSWAVGYFRPGVHCGEFEDLGELERFSSPGMYVTGVWTYSTVPI